MKKNRWNRPVCIPVAKTVAPCVLLPLVALPMPTHAATADHTNQSTETNQTDVNQASPLKDLSDIIPDAAQANTMQANTMQANTMQDSAKTDADSSNDFLPTSQFVPATTPQGILNQLKNQPLGDFDNFNQPVASLKQSRPSIGYDPSRDIGNQPIATVPAQQVKQAHNQVQAQIKRSPAPSTAQPSNVQQAQAAAKVAGELNQNITAGATQTTDNAPAVSAAHNLANQTTQQAANQSPDQITDIGINDVINPDDYLPTYQQQATAQQATTTQPMHVRRKKNPFKQLVNRVLRRDPGVTYLEAKITNADPEQEPAKNIKAALERITAESVEDFPASAGRLRQIATDAAQAVGYYDTKVAFRQLADDYIEVIVSQVGEPVIVKSRFVDIRGEGGEGDNALPVYEAIEQEIAPKVGDVLNHGVYEQAKATIQNVARTNGFFDARWLSHSADVILPDNTADIDLIYDTQSRYQFGDIKVYSIDKDGNLTDNPDKMPISPKLLGQLMTYQSGDPYYQPFVTAFSNNLTATRYFNGVDVDVVLPPDDAGNADLAFDKAQNPDPNTDPAAQTTTPETRVQNPEDYAPLQFSQDDTLRERLNAISNKAQDLLNAPEDIQLAADERTGWGPLATIANTISKIAKKIDRDDTPTRLAQASQQDIIAKSTPEQVYTDKRVPTYVVLDANKPHEAQVGIGYETDVGVRLVGKVNNNLVNRNGLQAGINTSLSKKDQLLEVTASHPYKHPINDKLTASIGYQHKKDDDFSDSFETDSVYANIARNVRRETGWNRTYSLRYRMDKLNLNDGVYDIEELPPPFNNTSSDANQQALLFGYGISRVITNNSLNPTKGYSQRYSIEGAVKDVLSDTSFVIARAGLAGIYTFGANFKHQVLARADLGYIYSDDFYQVPYRLRFFAGGDQSIRGYSNDSLGPRYKNDKFLIGGDALAVGSFEYNYQFRDGLRAAVFTDFGNAYDIKGDENNSTKVSVGTGIRWASPIGPVRLDVAHGLTSDNDGFKVHFFIGSPL